MLMIFMKIFEVTQTKKAIFLSATVGGAKLPLTSLTKSLTTIVAIVKIVAYIRHARAVCDEPSPSANLLTPIHRMISNDLAQR